MFSIQEQKVDSSVSWQELGSDIPHSGSERSRRIQKALQRVGTVCRWQQFTVRRYLPLGATEDQKVHHECAYHSQRVRSGNDFRCCFRLLQRVAGSSAFGFDKRCLWSCQPLLAPTFVVVIWTLFYALARVQLTLLRAECIYTPYMRSLYWRNNLWSIHPMIQF